VWWSAIGDPTNWPTPGTTAAAEVLSDFQNLAGNGGAIQKVIGTQNFAVIVQEKNIWRMEFIGAPEVFSFTLAEENRGTFVPGSVISDGRFVYYYGEDGFFLFDGTQSVPIGVNKVDDFIKSQLNGNDDVRMNAAVDPLNHLVMWAFPGDGNTAGQPNKILTYNWTDQAWTLAEIESEIIFQALSDGETLDELDPFGTLETLPYSLDSRVWQGGKSQIAGFSDDNKLAFFSGANLAATIETAEVQLNPNGRAYVNSILPITDAANVTMALGTRNLQSATEAFTGDVTVETATGEASFTNEARFHRARLKIAAGETWTEAVGVKFRAKNSGVL